MYPKTADLYLTNSDSPFRRQQTPPKPPKPKRAVTASVPEIRAIISTIKSENPWYAETESNLQKLFDWLWENDGQFDLVSVRAAVAVLNYASELEHAAPLATPRPVEPPGPPPFDWSMITEQSELPLDSPQYILEKATKSQLRSFLRRASGIHKK